VKVEESYVVNREDGWAVGTDAKTPD